MKRDEAISIVALVLLGLTLPIGVSTGLWSMTLVLEYVPYFIMAAMVGIFLWGFRERIEAAMNHAGKAVDSANQPENLSPHAEVSAQLEPEADIEQDDLPPIVEREYRTATLKFRIWSNTDWIEIGLKSSTHVTIKNHNLSKGTVAPIEEPDSSYLRIDNPEQDVFVIATFEVYIGPLFPFTRKGDTGTLRVDVLNKNDKLLFRMPEYGKTAQKYNYKDFGFEFSDWD
jgi:hypothetical protein